MTAAEGLKDLSIDDLLELYRGCAKTWFSDEGAFADCTELVEVELEIRRRLKKSVDKQNKK